MINENKAALAELAEKYGEMARRLESITGLKVEYAPHQVFGGGEIIFTIPDSVQDKEAFIDAFIDTRNAAGVFVEDMGLRDYPCVAGESHIWKAEAARNNPNAVGDFFISHSNSVPDDLADRLEPARQQFKAILAAYSVENDPGAPGVDPS